MISASFIVVGKVIIGLVMIGAMVMILMSIGHLFHHDDLNTFDDDNALREDVEKKENVVSEKSVFFNFLVDNDNSKKKRRD